jgi:hypothetical protein
LSAYSHISEVWQHEVVDAGREPAVWVLASFLVTFGITRAITHAIRDQKVRFLRDMNVGETHLHHLVPGIFLLLTSGLLAIAVDPPFPVWVLPVMFGIGAALTLDEFALWLHLEDVYWSQEGRRSIDAVVIAAALFGLSIIGYPFWFGVWTDILEVNRATLAGFHVVGIVLGLICLSKGKLYGGIVGLFVAPVGLIVALRLATPGSPWARRFYGPEKMKRSVARFGPARGAVAVAGEVRTAVARPHRNWRWLVRVVIAAVVVALLALDAVVRGPAVGNLVILVLILIGVALDAGALRRGTAFTRPKRGPVQEAVLGRDADLPAPAGRSEAPRGH